MKNRNLLLVACLTLASCTQVSLSDEEIMQKVWKCGKPCGLGDVLVFKKTNYTTIRNDTILRQDIPIAKIVKRNFNRFTEDTKIQVINIQNKANKDTCVYHAK
ncbi:MAG: hypothetical protein EOO96_10570 [Pedobacter sp.]|nr:MAG: hypothetical protein EOO96_10570 [Pedobacter sp.]